jgi:hypothetical protein
MESQIPRIHEGEVAELNKEDKPGNGATGISFVTWRTEHWRKVSWDRANGIELTLLYIPPSLRESVGIACDINSVFFASCRIIDHKSQDGSHQAHLLVSCPQEIAERSWLELVEGIPAGRLMDSCTSTRSWLASEHLEEDRFLFIDAARASRRTSIRSPQG